MPCPPFPGDWHSGRQGAFPAVPCVRYAFEMCRIHGMKQNEIAKVLGVSPALVHAMISEALLHCRQKAL
ncbi:sigma factor-like helix-turn-helix DNA-binding protein [Pseudomonas fluorescens]|uniref:sigma factor-like helix-turn-helix DNA-binding protein n=1 Tax=Pseudomonas fluorescens TaxID=294 RepID=UPI003990033E